MVNHSDETKDEIVQLVEKAMKLSDDEDKLEEEIKTWKEVLEYPNLNEDIKAIALRSLGLSILFRYKTFKNPSDLDQAIENFLECVNVLDSTDSDYCSDPEIYREVYDRLGEAYTYKFVQSNDFSDLDAAIDYVAMALENSEKQDAYHIEIVLELMRLLMKRYFEVPEEYKSLEDLNKVIELGNNIVKILQEGSEYHSFVMHALSKTYLQKHGLTNEEEDLKNAITSLVKLTSVVSHDDPRFEYGAVMLKFLYKSYPDVFSELKINLIDTEDVSVIQEIYDHLLENKLNEAIVRVDENLSKYPDDDVLLLFHKFLHAAFNGNPTCERILNQIKESDPGKERLMGLISSSEYSWNQKQGLRKLEVIPDHVDISKIKIKSENEAMSHRLKGQLYKQKGDYEKALVEYSKAIELDQTNEIFYLNRGAIYFEIHKDDLAIEDLSKAIKLNPNLVNAYFNRGEAKRVKEDYIGAIEDYSKAIELDPDDLEFYVRRALAYLGIKKFDLAIKDCNKAIEFDPNNFEARYYRGDAFLHKEEYELAINDLEKALAINPNHKVAVDAEYDLGLAYLNVENLDDALNNFLNVLNKDPNYFNAHRKIGAIYGKQGEYQKAINHLSKVIKSNPNNYEAYLNRGISHLRLENFDQAEYDLTNAKRINNLDPMVYKAMISILLKKKDYSNAISACNEAIQLFPNDYSFFTFRAKVYNAKGDIEAATNDLRIALDGEGANSENILNGPLSIDQLLDLFEI